MAMAITMQSIGVPDVGLHETKLLFNGKNKI
jgi:hypothetical protein